jgi:hypothetical protein
MRAINNGTARRHTSPAAATSACAESEKSGVCAYPTVTAAPRKEHNDRAPHSFLPGQKSAWEKCGAAEFRNFGPIGPP